MDGKQLCWLPCRPGSTGWVLAGQPTGARVAVLGSLGYRRARSSASVGSLGASEPATSFLGLIFLKDWSKASFGIEDPGGPLHRLAAPFVLG